MAYYENLYPNTQSDTDRRTLFTSAEVYARDFLSRFDEAFASKNPSGLNVCLGEVAWLAATVRAMVGRLEMAERVVKDLVDELGEHYPVAISARAMMNDEAKLEDLREVSDSVGNGSPQLRRTMLPERILKLEREIVGG